MPTSHEVEQWLQEGILAAKAGELEQARFHLLDVVEKDQTNETAWYWLFQVFDRLDDKRICLENLFIINPDNEWAKQELLNLLESSAVVARQVHPEYGPAKEVARPGNTGPVEDEAPEGRPVTLKLITAFWVGISMIFLVGGVVSAGDWLTSALRSRTFPGSVTLFQLIELVIIATFILGGVLGIVVAINLFLRSMIGFYGSLLLAVGLLLVGPTASLIASPPNYLALICIGGISGMIFLLTLASQPGFKHDSRSIKPSS